MKTRPNYLCIRDILKCMKKIRDYTEEHDFTSFSKEEITQDAVLRNLEIIGEASRNLTEETKHKVKTIPWNRMIGLRNIVFHKYFGVDLEIIWEIITKNLPETEPEIENLLNMIQTGSTEEE